MTIYYLQNGDQLEATAEFTLDKENFESYLDESGANVISGEAWEAVAEEIDGRLENFLDELLPLIAQQFLAGEIAGEFSGGLTND